MIETDELPFTLQEVQKPRGSSGLAKRFLESYYSHQLTNSKSLDKKVVDAIVGTPGALVTASDNIKHNEEHHTDHHENHEDHHENHEEHHENHEDHHEHPKDDEEHKHEKHENQTSEKAHQVPLGSDYPENHVKQNGEPVDAATLKYFKELLENKSLSQVPIVTLGKPNPADFRSEPDDTRDELMKNYPNIPVRKINDLDIYLIAYENFLARWYPNLKFNYTDPGRVDGHLNNLKNAIKLAFYDQYSLVRKAYLEVREQVFVDMKLPAPNDQNELNSIIKKMKPAHVLLEENRIRPEMFNHMIDSVFDSLQEKEILDIGGHKGHGYFLLWKGLPEEETKTQELGKHLYAIPSIGTFGHFLPEPGFSLVKEYGWPYFRDTEIIGFQIGHVRKILIENQDGDWEDWDLKGPIYLEVSDLEYEDSSISRIQIDGHFFQGTIYSQIE